MTVNKPWGSYTDIHRTEQLVFKTITIQPHSQLSLQSHDQRKEFWVVIDGECECQLNDYKYGLCVGDHILIPKHAKHRLINHTDMPCTVAEMQFGICAEEDIVRYEDDYGRI